MNSKTNWQEPDVIQPESSKPQLQCAVIGIGRYGTNSKGELLLSENVIDCVNFISELGYPSDVYIKITVQEKTIAVLIFVKNMNN